MAKRLLKLAGLAFFIVALAGLFGWVYLRSSLPQTRGMITLSGVDHPVTISRDRYGIPHIDAQTIEDAHFALGFVHAQDRLWQLEMHKRIAQGRISEIAGKEALGTDKFLRVLSVFDRARKAWAHLTPEARAGMLSYANGINAFLKAHKGALPPEFLLTGVTPEPWTPIDSIGWLKMMALDLGGNYWRELARLDLAETLTNEQINAFFSPYPGDPAIPIPDLETLYDGLDLAQVKTALSDPGRPRGLGSNNWVISGAHTKSGKPLLANDPHLGLNTPSLWYLVHLKIGGDQIIGASMPGLPYVVLGHNGTVAWGFTNLNPDVQDLYVEKLVDNGDAYLSPDGPMDFIRRQETIRIKGEDPYEFTVRETRHGPVISDARPDIVERLPDNAVLAMRWTALDEDDSTGNIGHAMSTAHDFGSFQEALKYFVAPVQNIVFADSSGNIGYVAPGRVPVRSPANDTYGRIPAPGWKAEYDWQSFIPRDEMPKRINPESGVIATANEKVVDDSYPYFLTSEWALPYRGDRIRELISKKRDHTVETMAAIQMDVKSTVAADLLPLMLQHLGQARPDIRTVLEDWDLEMAADRVEPLLYTAWHRALGKALYGDELGEKFKRYWGARAILLRTVLDGEGDDDRWCDNVTTEKTEDCQEIVTSALEMALSDLQDRLGGDWHDWVWGDVHKALQTHRPLSQVAALAPFFESRGAAPGGDFTVNVAGPDFNAADPFFFTHGPSYRVVYDLGDLDRSRYIIPTGQSGNPLSGHYRDMFQMWLKGDAVQIPLTIPEPDKSAVLTIEPLEERSADGL